MTRTKRSAFYRGAGAAAVLCLCLSASCGFAPGTVPVGGLVGRTDCKGSGAVPSRAEAELRAADQECVKYAYDGQGVLRLKHVNAGFNCCPGTISAEILAERGEIRIKEKESSSLCDCSCLYDIDYEFAGIKPGIWRISVVGPYQPEGDPPLEFRVDLGGVASGSYCVERTRYPWGT